MLAKAFCVGIIGMQLIKAANFAVVFRAVAKARFNRIKV